jgi:DNA-binding transcriptional LysR family regulator
MCSQRLRLSLEVIEVLDAIERRGSFSAAAIELHRVPSAVSYLVHKLEQDLGIEVFDRANYRARLTPLGRDLLRDGRRLLHAAGDLEARLRSVASGWETEIRIALDSIVPVCAIHSLLSEFMCVAPNTRVRVSYEVLGGGWDALLDGRADLSVGVPGEMPSGAPLERVCLGEVEYLFAVAPNHPLASSNEILCEEKLRCHRGIVVSDTSRRMPPRTIGLVLGQDALAVPTYREKVAAQLAGLGCGYLPKPVVERLAAQGRMIIKEVISSKGSDRFYLAWRKEEAGNGLKWWRTRLEQQNIVKAAFEALVLS